MADDAGAAPEEEEVSNPTRTKNVEALRRARSASFRGASARAAARKAAGDGPVLLGQVRPQPAEPTSEPTAPLTKEEELEKKFAAEMDEVKKAEAKHNQKWENGARVLVKRSNGQESVAYVVEYDTAKRLYIVALESLGSGKHKRVQERTLRAALAPQKYAIGACVHVKRSSGEESLGWVREFDAAMGVYRVELEEENSGFFKNADEEQLREGPAGDVVDVADDDNIVTNI